MVDATSDASARARALRREPLRALFVVWSCAAAIHALAAGLARPAAGPPPWVPIRLDPSTASVAELGLLPGIGEERARAIVLHRVRHGRFRSADDLTAVPGLGPKSVAALLPDLCFEAAESPN